MKTNRCSTLKSGGYITIPFWMVKDLGLHGDELIIFAIIYGFSQDGISHFTGTTRYLCTWTGKTKETVLKNLKSLRLKRLIERKKIPTSKANEKRYYCDYWATITRIPEDMRDKVIHNWSNLSALNNPQEVE